MKQIKLRIHHFFDIIRDFGAGKEFQPHLYHHSYHTVANIILNDPFHKIDVVIGSDSVCKGCIKLAGSVCTDIITHRTDFTGKEKFNNYLDARIMEVCGIKVNNIETPASLIRLSEKYISNIHFIYTGNDKEHTEIRRMNVLKGVDFYKRRHGLIL
jgi:hypothetical protein